VFPIALAAASARVAVSATAVVASEFPRDIDGPVEFELVHIPIGVSSGVTLNASLSERFEGPACMPIFLGCVVFRNMSPPFFYDYV